MTSYAYIIMIIVDLCMIWFNFDCIMQLKKSYYIATNVCIRKCATTFGDLPDWIGWRLAGDGFVGRTKLQYFHVTPWGIDEFKHVVFLSEHIWFIYTS